MSERDRLRVLVLCVAFLLTPYSASLADPTTSAHATAMPVASPPPWLDPFCQVEVRATPINTAPASQSASASAVLFALSIVSQSGPSVDAHVTLLSDAEAYDVPLHNISVAGENYKYESAPILIQLPKTMKIRYAYVDSYAIAGDNERSCPSEPFDVSKAEPARMPPPSGQTPRIVAVFKQTLPPLPCGKLFSVATVARVPQMVDPLPLLDDRRTAQIAIFVDSTGRAIKTYVYKSTGIALLDYAATQAALGTQYNPEMLLCAPVVSEYLFRADFGR